MMGAVNEVINHEGVVTSNSGELVIISISAKSACSGCHAKGSCNMSGSQEKIVEIPGHYNLKAGDIVNVEMSRSMGFTALFFGYVLPFFVLLITLLIMVLLSMTELTAGLTAIGTLIPYYLAIYLCRNRLSKKFMFTLKE